jgi:putative PIN family toxin of toxin-antitoxin system
LVHKRIHQQKFKKKTYPLLVHPGFGIFYSQHLLEEYQKVIVRPFFRKHVSSSQVSRFLRLVLPVLTKVNLKSEIQLSRDSNDDHVLSFAVDAKARYLISSDKDLLVLKHIGKTKILTMTEFLNLMSAKGIL